MGVQGIKKTHFENNTLIIVTYKPTYFNGERPVKWTLNK